MKLLVILGALVVAAAQTNSQAIVTNLDTAKWDQSGGELLRTDPVSGGMDLLVRFSAGHVIPAHLHDSNEHIIVVEGQLENALHILSFLGWGSEVARSEIDSRSNFDHFVRQ
jgi:hypothetical protein